MFFIALLAVLALTAWAQYQVSHQFNKYAQVANRRGITGAQAAAELLHARGVRDVRILPCDGHLTDHYDPRDNTIYLSEGVYNAPTVAAVGVACHEAGHACQYAEHYAPIRVRSAIIPVCQVGSTFSYILIIIGLVLYSQSWFGLGVVLFSFTTLFQLITLPVEFNASGRALATIEGEGILYEDEYYGARKVLRAAALTYVAAMLTSLLYLLRYVTIFLGMGRDDR
jgi:Zn-dependent membrane protease YugP